MAKQKKLITCDDAKPAKCQHQSPCSDCPFSRKSLHGWLGGGTVTNWITCVHGEVKLVCHVHVGAQCAGAAIYRANVGKRCRDDSTLRLEKDKEKVFATPMEFTKHHEVIRFSDNEE